jgi:hypothetical protein
MKARLRAVGLTAVAAAIFVFSFLFRFNDPGGTFAGLTDDHFFYAVRGWQILHGDLPARDFVDHGAPLFYYIAAAVQVVGGRGTLPEVVFCTVALSLGAALTSLVAARASRSILLGGLAAVTLVLLEPRLYNYPKILIYAAAIPMLWAFANRPSARRALAVAIVTVVAFLFRHDHGLFVALAAVSILVLRQASSWRERLVQVATYSALVLACLSPYLVFLQIHGGAREYFQQAYAWAERDRQRAPVEWPGPFEQPAAVAGSDGEDGAVSRAIGAIRANNVAWLFYLELALPLLAFLALACSTDAFRPGWPHAAAKIGCVAVLGVILNAGFLRSPLEARLADPAVPHVILFAWLCRVVWQLLRSGRDLRPAVASLRRPVAVAGLVSVTFIVTVGAIAVTKDVATRFEKAWLTEGIGVAVDRAGNVRDRLARQWPLERWASPTDAGVLKLAFYLRRCTQPSDRVFVQDYLPQVIALSDRAFAAGHADLRSGFFETPEAERLAIERLRRQSVPVIALSADEWFEGLHESHPRLARYLADRYRVVGDRSLDDRYAVTLLVDRNRMPTGHDEALDAPCFG